MRKAEEGRADLVKDMEMQENLLTLLEHTLDRLEKAREVSNDRYIALCERNGSMIEKRVEGFMEALPGI